MSAVESQTRPVSQCTGSALSWTLAEGVIELALHRPPCNELGSSSLEEFEKFATALQAMQAEVPGASFAKIEGAGHLANFEQPERFNAALLGFLKDVA